MTAPNVSTGAPVIYGLSSPGGTEETPELRYEESDKDGVRKVTAVLARKIHCLKRYAEAIKQSAAFPGQVVEVDGVVYGANWICRNVNVVPAGEASIVQIESFREGVTPFEWELPPGLSCEIAAGVATLYYTKTNGTKAPMAQWDSRTGENRYGWSVDYYPDFLVKHGWAGFPQYFQVYKCAVSLERVPQFIVDGAGALAASGMVSSTVEEYPPAHLRTMSGFSGNFYGAGYDSDSDAVAAGTEALPAWIENLNAQIIAALDFDSFRGRYELTSGILEVHSGDATVEAYNRGSGFEHPWAYILKCPCARLTIGFESYGAAHKKGLFWESVSDNVETSETYRHVFYRLVYANVVLLSLDVTSAEASP